MFESNDNDLKSSSKHAQPNSGCRKEGDILKTQGSTHTDGAKKNKKWQAQVQEAKSGEEEGVKWKRGMRTGRAGTSPRAEKEERGERLQWGKAKDRVAPMQCHVATQESKGAESGPRAKPARPSPARPGPFCLPFPALLFARLACSFFSPLTRTPTSVLVLGLSPSTIAAACLPCSPTLPAWSAWSACLSSAPVHQFPCCRSGSGEERYCTLHSHSGSSEVRSKNRPGGEIATRSTAGKAVKAVKLFDGA